MISSGMLSRVVIGVSRVTSSGGRSTRRPPTTTDSGRGDGDIALSQIAASRPGARTGDSVQLPTVTGLESSGWPASSADDDRRRRGGDIVLASDALARTDWAAVRDQVSVAYSSAAEAASHRDDFAAWGGPDRVRRCAVAHGRHHRHHPIPVTVHTLGYVVMISGGPERPERLHPRIGAASAGTRRVAGDQ